VVEGYVDVIAMVTSGFAGAVAPLGTALTENQLALLWKMADEPILCFDGDRAGQEGGVSRRRSWRYHSSSRARACALRCCRKGRTPTTSPLRRNEGAIEEVIAAARNLSDILWSREIEGGNFATPERRAALEARIGELANGIRDEVLRRYYRQDFPRACNGCSRPRPALAPAAGAGFGSESPRRFQPRFSGNAAVRVAASPPAAHGNRG